MTNHIRPSIPHRLPTVTCYTGFFFTAELIGLVSIIGTLSKRQPGQRWERHRIRENPKSPLRMTGGEQFDVLRLDPMRV